MQNIDEKTIEKLIKTGLTDKEARIYGYLLGVPGAYPSDIATKTHLNRSTVYKLLVSLSIKGLVTEIEKGKKLFYQVEAPQKLTHFTRYQLERAETASEYAHKLLPELEGLLLTSSGKPRVTFYEGRERVIEAYMSHVQVKKGYKMAAFVSVSDLRNFMPEKKFRHYVKEKERLGITVRGITSSEPYSYDFNDEMFRGIKKVIWPVLKYIPYEMFPFPGEITMFDENKVSIIKLVENNPIGVIIEDKIIHDMMYAIFEIAWIGADYIKK